MDNNKEIKKSKEILINLYQNLKIRKLEEVKNNFIIYQKQLEDNVGDNSFDEEKKYLQKLSLLTLTEYIESAIGVIISLRIEDELSKINKDTKKEEDLGDWETLLRKNEEDIRMYISNEIKLKLYIDQMEEKMEILEKENKSLLLKLEKAKDLENQINK